MTMNGLPAKQGLYDPIYERDACGIGFIANIKGDKSSEIVSQALEILCRLKHRGGQGSDPSTGDGAGILTQIPHELFVLECLKEGISLPMPDFYGVGMVFLPQTEDSRALYEQLIENIAVDEGQVVLGWRTVPVDDSVMGISARAAKPMIRQVFIAAASDFHEADELAFERKLYLIRKRVELEASRMNIWETEKLYFTSLSCRTIVYKGLLLPEHLAAFYQDLSHPSYTSALALVHSRFSTNTFPSWERAHPYRYMIHNGEINTIKGNVNWMRARERACESEYFDDLDKIRPVIDQSGSDSSIFDNVLEFLMLTGRSMSHSVMMMISEPWEKDETMNDQKKAFYEYHSSSMEPWDGPAAVAFTDGKQIGAVLDRNGLRPARYYVTKDDRIILSSEVGIIDIAPENIVRKDRLRPGQMLLVDTVQGRIVPDREIKQQVAEAHPYREWTQDTILYLDELKDHRNGVNQLSKEAVAKLQHVFGYTYEELNKVIAPLALRGDDPTGSMGYDAPLAVLSERPQLLYSYFKQMFAQVTNPPIDAFLEEMIVSVESLIGPEIPLLQQNKQPENLQRIRLKTPILTNDELARIKHNQEMYLKTASIPMLFPADGDDNALESALENLVTEADLAVASGAALLILTDRGVNEKLAPIPALLSVAALHNHLIEKGTRTKVSLIVESGEPREVHHMAMLLSYGVDAINPYLAFDSIHQMLLNGQFRLEETDESITSEELVNHYVSGVTKGILKVISKMGISTIHSYIGAQICEAVGIRQEVVDRYFTATPTRIGGIGLEVIARETLIRHQKAYAASNEHEAQLESGDDFQWRHNGEEHLFNPQTIHTLQHACRQNDYSLFKRYSKLIDEETQTSNNLRGLLDFVDRKSVPIEEVEPVESILKRFKSGAMSYGSISQEAHEALAIAMNSIGAKSNSGEGGEDSARYTPDTNGDSRNSAIKQVASGRFGVTSQYLMNATEIQIKMAQGAKPGEGGQLPARKVYPWIAKARGSTPGVELISPPPHHDIYSIEDLAELIYDLKNANSAARINVKLVSEAGVGTIAAGVAKARADVILISGYDGGTGAASRTSIKNAGMPWEIGLAEAHQTLVLNGLRNKVTLETDGKLMTGRDVVIAALLGAEEYGFATVPLVVLGCVMMRVCHMDTCPVGIATQNPELRANFKGDPEHIVNFMRFMAQEVREWLAKLGFRSVNELVGRTDILRTKEVNDHWKAAAIDLSPLLYQPSAGDYRDIQHKESQDHELDQTLDVTKLIELTKPAIEDKQKVHLTLPIQNTNRAVGTILGSKVTKRYGAEGLPEDTILVDFKGTAGQSFGAFMPSGMTFTLEGDANDHVGKGLSGGKIAIYPPAKSSFVPEKNIIIGNVAFFGATSGEAYIRGVAGERFCVRNSGANVVVEGVGNHGCEYMTGGRVVVLGEIGKNFAAGMSGGIAYVWAESMEAVKQNCNLKMVLLEALQEREEIQIVKRMIENHVAFTGSLHAQKILGQWERNIKHFVRIVPADYKRMVKAIERFRQSGVPGDEALLAAFQERKNA